MVLIGAVVGGVVVFFMNKREAEEDEDTYIKDEEYGSINVGKEDEGYGESVEESGF